MYRDHKKIERLILFSEVAKQLSFSKAAKKLAISPGYLSDQIRRLEQELAAPLLIRSTRNIRITEDGLKVLAEVEKIKRTMADMERGLKDDRAALSGLIKITAPKLFSQYFLADICSDFQQLHPEVRFEIDCTYDLRDLIAAQYDLAFRSTNSPPQNMIAKHLLSYRHVCCAAPSYLAQQGHPTTIHELQQHQCLFGPGDNTWAFKSEQVDVKGWFNLNDHQILKAQAIAGRGIIKIAEYVVKDDVKQGRLEIIDLNAESLSYQIYLVHPQTLVQTARLKAFMAFTAECLNAQNP
jgi:DNA-binding transcriptional LysR family regulator